MIIRLNVEKIQRQMFVRGLTYTDLDRKARMGPSWANRHVRRAVEGRPVQPATAHKIAKAIGCKPGEIADFDKTQQGKRRPRAPKAGMEEKAA